MVTKNPYDSMTFVSSSLRVFVFGQPGTWAGWKASQMGNLFSFQSSAGEIADVPYVGSLFPRLHQFSKQQAGRSAMSEKS